MGGLQKDAWPGSLGTAGFDPERRRARCESRRRLRAQPRALGGEPRAV